MSDDGHIIAEALISGQYTEERILDLISVKDGKMKWEDYTIKYDVLGNIEACKKLGLFITASE